MGRYRLAVSASAGNVERPLLADWTPACRPTGARGLGNAEPEGAPGDPLCRVSVWCGLLGDVWGGRAARA